MKTPNNAPDIKVGHKTPDEIKKGLECCMDYQNCIEGEDPQCPFYDVERCMEALLADAIALIQQLQADKIGLLESSHEMRKDMLARIQHLEDHLREATKKVKQFKAERDAAVADITRMVQDPYEPAYCDYCKMTEEECEKRDCKLRSAFVWRGIQKEATP